MEFYNIYKNYFGINPGQWKAINKQVAEMYYKGDSYNKVIERLPYHARHFYPEFLKQLKINN